MFDIDFHKKGELLIHRRKFLLYPKYWEEQINHISLNLHWGHIKFNEDNVDLAPDKKGIYCFIVKPDIPFFFKTSYLFYVGETTRTLKIRFKEYINDQKGKRKPRSKVFEMLKLYKDYLHFYYAEIDNENDIHKTEEKLINTFVPFINSEISRARLSPELRKIYEA
ncbi:MAG: GIY-YIG nuclease family protein [Bacteroidales bacterium]|nr:GIY-YIG nuclease family protein [Bacteroidales bacterium]